MTVITSPDMTLRLFDEANPESFFDYEPAGKIDRVVATAVPGWGVEDLEARSFYIRAYSKIREVLMGGGMLVVVVPNDDLGWHRERLLGTGFKEASRAVPLLSDGGRVMWFTRPRDESNWNVEGAARRASKAGVGAAARGVGRTHVR